MSDLEIPFIRAEVSGIDDPEAGTAIILFVAGCPRSCPECHNPQLQDASAYVGISVGFIVECLGGMLDHGATAVLVEAVVFQGGDWAEYPEAYCEIAEWCRQKGLRTVLYTGELYENLPETVRRASDWVIDGPWDQDVVSVFPPSSNQRVFHQGRSVEPEQLPLYRHLLELRPVESEEKKQGG